MLTKQSLNNSRLPKSTMKRMTQELLTWICEKHATNSPLSRDILRDKALQLRKQYGLSEKFKCSKLWMTHFLKTYGFSPTLTSYDGPIFQDYRIWIDLLRNIITQYKHKDFFSVDELRMFPNVSPENVWLQIRNNTFKRNKNKPEKVTMLLCCNSSGSEKLPPLICGPYKNEDTERSEDGVYCCNENSEISDEVFVSWLAKFNERLVQDNRKVLLLIHRSRIRASGDPRLSNISLLFFPKDFPANLLPLRRELFHYLKIVYRQEYAKEIEKGHLGSWTWDHVKQTLLQSWENVPRELIISNFQKTTFRDDDRFLEFTNPDFWHALKPEISFRKFVTFDDELSNEPNSMSLNHQIFRNLRSRKKKFLDIDLEDQKKENISKRIKFNENKRTLNNNTEESDVESCIIINTLTDSTAGSADDENESSSNSVRSVSDDLIQESTPLCEVMEIDCLDNSASNVNREILMPQPTSSNVVHINHNLCNQTDPMMNSTSKSDSPPNPLEPNKNLVSQFSQKFHHTRDPVKLILESHNDANVIKDEETLLNNIDQNQSQVINSPNNPNLSFKTQTEHEVRATEGSSSDSQLMNIIGQNRDDNWAKIFEHTLAFGENSPKNFFTKKTTEENNLKKGEKSIFTLGKGESSNNYSDD